MVKNKDRRATRRTASLLRLLGQPARLRILLAIAEEEACVCHLEALLGYRQAYISQHLMALRAAGLVASRREGRNIFYRLVVPSARDLILQAAVLAGVNAEEQDALGTVGQPQACTCPHCLDEKTFLRIEEVKTA